jgi:hypothetical protein
MRNFKKTVIILVVLLSIQTYCYSVKLNVYFNVTSNVSCNIGDTLCFYSAGTGSHGVWINNFTTLAFGGFVTGLNTLLTEYKVQPNDTNFTITFQPNASAWSGTITILSIPTNISNLNKLLKLNIYPSIVNAELNVEYYKNIEKVFILNVNGTIVKTITDINNNNMTINTETLPEGIYYLEVENIRQKFIKIK